MRTRPIWERLVQGADRIGSWMMDGLAGRSAAAARMDEVSMAQTRQGWLGELEEK